MRTTLLILNQRHQHLHRLRSTCAMSQTTVEAPAPATPPGFKYQPLDQSEDCIQVIEILPIFLDTDYVQCTVRHLKFSERSQYEAFSYMWGDSSQTAYIIVDGAILEVTLNLRDALWFLRHRANGTSPAVLDRCHLHQPTRRGGKDKADTDDAAHLFPRANRSRLAGSQLVFRRTD